MSTSHLSTNQHRSSPLVKVEKLNKHFSVPSTKSIFGRGTLKAVSDVSFQVEKGSTLGIVGESGSGKSTTGRLISRLLEPTSGQILFDGEDVTHAKGSRLKKLRSEIQMVFQDPFASLNPRQTVASIISAPFRYQTSLTRAQVRDEVLSLLERVGLKPDHANRYPHQFSGGQRQRIGIARAIALRPKLLVCDEPVSALDVSIQAQVINLLDDLKRDFEMTMIFISHDLSVVHHISDSVAVMYMGEVVEFADRKSIFESPQHDYTKSLLSAIPVADPRSRPLTNRP